jgi:hypothetical protein
VPGIIGGLTLSKSFIGSSSARILFKDLIHGL